MSIHPMSGTQGMGWTAKTKCPQQVYNLIVQKVIQNPGKNTTLTFTPNQGVSFGTPGKVIPDTLKLASRVHAKGLATLSLFPTRNQDLLHEELTRLVALSETDIGKEEFLAEVKELEIVYAVNQKEVERPDKPDQTEASSKELQPTQSFTSILAQFFPPPTRGATTDTIAKVHDLAKSLTRKLHNPVYDIQYAPTPQDVVTVVHSSGIDKFPIYPTQYSSHTVLPILAALLGEHILYDGTWGIGKTAVPMALSMVLFNNAADDVEAGMMRCTPDMRVADYFAQPMPDRLLRGERRFSYHPFLVPRGVKIADEINRMYPAQQNALLGVMNTGYHLAEWGEKVFTGDFDEQGKVQMASWHLTRNRRGEGTFPLEFALVDRISVSIVMEPYNKAFLAIDQGFAEFNPAAFKQEWDREPAHRFSDNDWVDARNAIACIPMQVEVWPVLSFMFSHMNFAPEGHPENIVVQKKAIVESPNGMDMDPVSHFVDRAQGASDPEALYLAFQNGVESARIIRQLLLYAKGMAWWRGSSGATIDDVRAVIPYVLRHRTLISGARAETKDTLHHLWDLDFYRKQLVDKAITELATQGSHYQGVLGELDPIQKALRLSRGVNKNEKGEVSRVAQELIKIMEAIINAERGAGRDKVLALQYLLDQVIDQSTGVAQVIAAGGTPQV